MMPMPSLCNVAVATALANDPELEDANAATTICWPCINKTVGVMC